MSEGSAMRTGDDPLVTIGVPTYNRSGLLARALGCLLEQDAAGVEIVVSDNASTDDTPAVLRDIAERHPTVRTFRHESGVPVPENFTTVLRNARGKYFMWAADDDDWDPRLVSTLASHLDASPGVALVAPEAQYVTAEGSRLPFVAEGKPWYGATHATVEERLAAVIRHSYGNLIYGMYRREALLTGTGTVLDHWRSLNEIPVFLRVATRGDIQVRSEVLFYKTAPVSTYLAVARFRGVPVQRETLPSQPAAVPPAASVARRIIGSRRAMLRYHVDAAKDCLSALAETSLAPAARARLQGQLLATMAIRAAGLTVQRKVDA